MKKLGVKKFSESTQLYSQENVYGSVREIIEDFKKTEKVKNASLVMKSGANLKKTGAMLMFVVKEVDDSKPAADLLCSDDIFLSRVMSDQIRSGEVHISALLDFVVVHHTNYEQSASAGAEYPLIVRPTSVEDPALLAEYSISADTKVTKTYKRDNSIDDVLSQLQF